MISDQQLTTNRLLVRACSSCLLQTAFLIPLKEFRDNTKNQFSS